MTTISTRRAVLAGASALPALSIPTLAADRDPVFAAIERFQTFNAEATVTAEREPPDRSPEYPSWEAKREEEMKKWNALRDAMLQTVPTTRAGALALIAATQNSFGLVDDIDAEDALILLNTIAKAVQS